MLSFFRKVFEKYPRAFSSIEISVYMGLFVFNVWVVPFWFWGIYRLNIAFLEGLELLFYKLWHGTAPAGFISITFGLLFFILSSLMRQDSLKELGIRFDNFYESGRECAIISLISIAMILFFSILYFDKSSPHSFVSTLTGFFKFTPWGITKRITEGIVQQFLLQSVTLARFFQIFGNRAISLVAAAMLFSLAHSPNIKLMFFSFFFGLIVCVLFLRNRNIFTLGIMHGVLSIFFTSFLVPGLVNEFKIGPWRGNTEFVASIDYNGGRIETNPSKTIVIPITVTNKSTVTWDSKDQNHPVCVSYHSFSAKGDIVDRKSVV